MAAAQTAADDSAERLPGSVPELLVTAARRA